MRFVEDLLLWYCIGNLGFGLKVKITQKMLDFQSFNRSSVTQNKHFFMRYFFSLIFSYSMWAFYFHYNHNEGSDIETPPKQRENKSKIKLNILTSHNSHKNKCLPHWLIHQPKPTPKIKTNQLCITKPNFAFIKFQHQNKPIYISLPFSSLCPHMAKIWFFPFTLKLA